MNSPSSVASGAADGPRKHSRFSWRRLGFNFLTISILAHFLFGVGATYLVVQTFQPKRAQNFTAPSAGPRAPTQAMEHKVQMQKKQQTMSAPVVAKRITTTANSRIALPPMPAMPKMDADVVPVVMAGMGGNGTGLGMGSGGGSGTGGGGGGGATISLFGVRTSGNGMAGHLYDLKQGPTRQPTGMTPDKYTTVLSNFARGGFNMSILANYYQARGALYAGEIFTPCILADEGPRAYNVQGEVKPEMWVALYAGRVSPPESGSYRFVAFGDDVMIIRFNNRIVLDRGYINPSGVRTSTVYHYKFNGGNWYPGTEHDGGHGAGLPMDVVAGTFYDLQILVGEHTGGQCMFQIMLQKDGVTYDKDADGNPALPIFRMANVRPVPGGRDTYPPHIADGPIWKVQAAPAAGALPPINP